MSLGIKFRIEFSIFGPNIPKKVFKIKTKKVYISIEFCILELV